MDIVNAFFEGVLAIVPAFGDVLVDATLKVGEIFYTPGVEGAAGQLTIVGAGLAMGVGVGAIYLLFRLVRGLIKTNERG